MVTGAHPAVPRFYSGSVNQSSWGVRGVRCRRAIGPFTNSMSHPEMINAATEAARRFEAEMRAGARSTKKCRPGTIPTVASAEYY